MAESGSTSELTSEDLSDYEKLRYGYYIYIIRERDTDFYKVGFTKDPQQRKTALQCGNPRKLIFKRVKRVENARDEKALHRALKAAGFESSGGGGTEWFKVPKAKKIILYDLFNKIPNASLTEYQIGGDDD